MNWLILLPAVLDFSETLADAESEVSNAWVESDALVITLVETGSGITWCWSTTLVTPWTLFGDSSETSECTKAWLTFFPTKEDNMLAAVVEEAGSVTLVEKAFIS